MLTCNEKGVWQISTCLKNKLHELSYTIIKGKRIKNIDFLQFLAILDMHLND